MQPSRDAPALEIEAKFAIPTRDHLERLSSVASLAGLDLGPAASTNVVDTYFDTPDGAIMAAGYAWRQRESDGRVTTTLKRLSAVHDGVHRREELEVEATGHPCAWPEGAPKRCALEILGGRLLLPIAIIRQRRLVRPVRAGRRLVALMSLDDVEAACGGRTERFQEAEIEVQPEGTEEDLRVLSEALRHEWGLRPEPRAKFERAIALRGSLLAAQEHAFCRAVATRKDRWGRRALALLSLDGGGSIEEASDASGLTVRQVRYWRAAFLGRRLGVFPASVSPQGEGSVRDRPVRRSRALRLVAQRPLAPSTTLADAARRTLAVQLRRLKAHERGTREGKDPEELHDMRVATRRMRAALLIFADAFDPSLVRRLRRGLRRLGRRLGAVRDLDVFGIHLERYVEGLPPERRAELDGLVHEWASRRESARQRLLAYLDGPKYPRLLDAVETFVLTTEGEVGPFAPDGSARPRRIAHVLPAILYARAAAVRAYEDWIGPHPPLGLLHRLRIAVKALRYTLEFFSDVLGPSTQSLVEELKGIQDHLGEIQDGVVAVTVLRNVLTWGTWEPAEGAPMPPAPLLAPGVAAYLAERERELERLVDSFPSRWACIGGQALMARLAEATSTDEKGSNGTQGPV